VKKVGRNKKKEGLERSVAILAVIRVLEGEKMDEEGKKPCPELWGSPRDVRGGLWLTQSMHFYEDSF